MTKTDFIARMHLACDLGVAKGAQINVPLAVAQAALESYWGNSKLTRLANNLFGIKAFSSWKGDKLELPTYEFSVSKGWYKTTAYWRNYSDWVACILDYAHLIASISWFKDALLHVEDPEKFLLALLPEKGQPGWATDPKYFEKVKRIGAVIQKLGGPAWG